MQASVPRVASLRSRANAIALRLIPAARSWRNIGDDVTFTSRGFVAADSPQTLLARHNYEIDEIRQRLTGSYRRSLEIGCGFGRLSPYFAGSSAEHIGLDINPEALALAGRHYPQFTYTEASVADLPFPDGTFDLISTWTVLQHVRPAAIEKAVREIGRVASPSGTILLCEESALSNKAPPDRWHTHTWHRRPGFYAERLHMFSLIEAKEIESLTNIGIPSPGTVILLRGHGLA